MEAVGSGRLLATLQEPLPPMEPEPHCELEVLDALKQQLLQKRAAIISPLERPATAKPVAGNNERNAALYRQGQLEVLAAALQAVDGAQRTWCERHGVDLDEGEEEEDLEEDEEQEEKPPAKKMRL
ncbi:unnamed protein product [Polarella glacialis]|nr:unnamed protein product [Polarella glacialis]